MNTEFKKCGDVLLIPIGLKGHIDPMLYVAKELVKFGVSMTMLVQEPLRELVDADIEEQVKGLRIQVAPMERLTRPMWAGNFPVQAFGPLLKKILADKQAGAEGPKCMISDMLSGWTQEWADKLDLPRYVLCPSPATFGLVMNNFSGLIANGLLKGNDPNPVLEVPGCPILHLSDLPPMAAKMPQFMYENGDTFKHCAGILFNTFYELEARAVNAFRAEVEITSTRKKATEMYSIGPMLPNEYFSEENVVGHEDSETIQWLNTRAELSVLYVAFGSMAYLSPKEILELAQGLAASQVSFLWVLRMKATDGEPMDVSKLLPPDFEALTKDRGLVYTEFAPQLQILSHPATGGFLTHCGWNSVLESLCRGVPMLAWPMNAEQGLNCRIIVDEAKVATEVKKGKDGSVEKGVEDGAKLLMTDPLGKQFKEKVLKLRRQARVAVAPGGSSHKNVQLFGKDIQSMS